MSAWYFQELQPSGTMLAIEPSGAQHVIKNGDMNSLAGRALLEAMARDLAATATLAETVEMLLGPLGNSHRCRALARMALDRYKPTEQPSGAL